MFFSLPSCRLINYKDTKVEVYVENVSLHEPLVNHPVFLKEMSSSISGNSVAIIDRQFTDNKGVVNFAFEAHKNHDYEVEFDYQGGREGFVTLSLDRNDPNGTLDRVDVIV